MSKKDKLIKRLKSKPKDFGYDEAVTLLSILGYVESNKGKTSGSRVAFRKDKHSSIGLHKPHPRKDLLLYQVIELIKELEKEGLI